MTNYPKSAMLHLLCGKIASGKSTLAKELANQSGTVLISEDEWLGALFSDEIRSIEDYTRCARKLKNVMAPHVISLLACDVSVVLDFPANTKGMRKWMLKIIENTNAPHVLHVLEATDEVCLARMKKRNAEGKHPFSTNEEQFHQVSSFFEPPQTDEGFEIKVHRQRFGQSE